MMRKRLGGLLLCLCLWLPGIAGAMDAFELRHMENATINVQILLPTNWVAAPAVEVPPLYTYILYDGTDPDMQRYVMLSSLPKTGEVPEEIAGFRDEAELLFSQGEGKQTAVVREMTIDRMRAVAVKSLEEPFYMVFINDTDRFIFLMYPDPQTIASETFGDEVETICDSIALLNNPHDPIYDEEAFDVVILEEANTVGIAGYRGDALRVDIPPSIHGDQVISISDNAFADQRIEHVSIPDTVEVIGVNAFSGCNYLRTVTLPQSLKQMENGAFESCFLLQRVALPSSLEKLGANVFWGCVSLEDIMLPSALKSIEDGAFVMTLRMANVAVGAENEHFTVQDGVLFSKDMQRLILYPSCLPNTTYTIPESVRAVSAYAFAYAANLEEVIVPSTVWEIKALAFVGAVNLKTAVIESDHIAIAEDAFVSSAHAMTIYGNTVSTARTFAQEAEIQYEEMTAYTATEAD